MPRFLIETDAIPRSRVEALTRASAVRFPEVWVDASATHRDGDSTRTLWVCGAPSRTHLERWAKAVQHWPLIVRRIEPAHVSETTAGEELR